MKWRIMSSITSSNDIVKLNIRIRGRKGTIRLCLGIWHLKSPQSKINTLYVSWLDMRIQPTYLKCSAIWLSAFSISISVAVRLPSASFREITCLSNCMIIDFSAIMRRSSNRSCLFSPTSWWYMELYGRKYYDEKPVLKILNQRKHIAEAFGFLETSLIN